MQLYYLTLTIWAFLIGVSKEREFTSFRGTKVYIHIQALVLFVPKIFFINQNTFPLSKQWCQLSTSFLGKIGSVPQLKELQDCKLSFINERSGMVMHGPKYLLHGWAASISTGVTGNWRHSAPHRVSSRGSVQEVTQRQHNLNTLWLQRVVNGWDACQLKRPTSPTDRKKQKCCESRHGRARGVKAKQSAESDR